MPPHEIRVTLENTPHGLELIADPNPLEVNQTEQVIWIFPTQPPDLRVEFKAFMRRDTDASSDSTRNNPFVPPFPGSPTVGPGTIRADAEPGMYFYNIVDARTDQAIKWQTHLLQAHNSQGQPAGFEAFFGGIIIRDP